MKESIDNSRRKFLRLSTGALVPALGLTRFGMLNALAQQPSDYKALVCLFMFGGNDGHNTLIPQAQADLNTYKSIRGTLALPDGNGPVLPITAKNGVPFALNNGLSAIHPLWAQQKLAAVANVGNLVQPTTRQQFQGSAVPLPTNLFSHSDQVIQMQTATPSGSGGTGWAGRVADAMQPANNPATFPASISIAGPSLFCAGNVVQSASIIPGFDMQPYGMTIWPSTAAAARLQGLQEVLTMDSGLAVVQAANKVRQDALALSAMLKSVPTTSFNTVFPGTQMGNQLKEVARIIKLRTQTGMKRQVFFCSIGGFDTHSSQSWQHWDLLRQMSEAMAAFFTATIELGVADQVTTFTESEFGRTLQPSGQGSDHGWGSHHLVMGGAVQGGDLYGKFPNLALGGPDDTGSRGALLPTTSLDQYGATLGRWFGLDDASLLAVFPNLKNFANRNLGFLG
jgi:uncharacterized protein (DUF1501 family)